MELLQAFNDTDGNIRFQLEHPDATNTLRLLDFSVKLSGNGTAEFDFYRKTAKKDLFVNFHSALPTGSKFSFIRNETERIVAKCSSEATASRNVQQFRNVLRLNEYPESIVCEATARRRPLHRARSNTQTEPFYFPVPFISDRVNRQIRQLFHREGIPFASATALTL